MPRLTLILAAFVAAAGVLLALRQERLRTRNEIARQHAKVQQLQSVLWRQQIEMASWTSPQTLHRLTGVKEEDPTEPMRKLLGIYNPD